MAVDKNKIIAEATKLVQKGAIDKAITTYQKILAEDAKDVRVLLKVGELYQKKGDERLAADAFTRVAETYAEQGFFLKAVAVYKQIVKLAPEDVRVNERLAGLYQQLGLMSDAMGQLQFMASAYEKAGDGAKLTEVLQRMVELDPENIASSIKLGELHSRAGNAQAALECLQRAAAYLKKHSRTDEYLKVAERIAALQGDDLALTKELANIYLAKGDTKRALAKLQLCFKADPKDVDTLHLLAQAFRDLGQTSKTLSVYKELAHVHEEQGRHGDARATWRKVQELSPEDPDAATALGPAHPAATPIAAPPPPPGPPPGVRAAPPPMRPPGPVAQASGSDQVQKLLTETDVYVKYGLHDKALDHLKRVFAVDPQSPEAHDRAREIHLAAGRPSDAGDAGVAAVHGYLARGLGDKARDALYRLRHVDPGNPHLPELVASCGGTDELEMEDLIEASDVVLDPAAARPDRADEDALAIAAAGADSEDVVEEEVIEEAEEADEPLQVEAQAALDEGVALEVGDPEPHLDDAGDALAEAAAAESAESEEVMDEPIGPVILAPPPPPPTQEDKPVPAVKVPPAPRPPLAPARPVAAKPAAAAGPAEPRAAPARPGPAPARPAAPKPAPAAPAPRPAVRQAQVERPVEPPPPPAPPDEEEADLSDELEEAGFFVQQGLVDDARAALQNLLEFYPGHTAVRAKLAELDRREAPAERAGQAPQRSPVLAASPSAGDESFDIARELAAELGPTPSAGIAEEEFQYSVEDVFSQFKKGVEATVQKEDSATHYDLGIAYREMGLLDDALHEFETALDGNDRRREVDCLTMIGLCRMAQEQPKEAIGAYRRALGSEFLTKDAAKDIHFELGAVYEADGQPEVGLFYLQKVARADPGYRDVKARVAGLGGGPGKPPPEGDARAAGAAATPRPVNGMVARTAPPRQVPAAPAPAPTAGAKKNIGYL